jgi:hypothetical protein
MEANQFVDDENDFTEEDEISVSINSYVDLNITTTDWTIETIINQLKKGNIELNPDFQRRKAWTNEKRNRFIESLVLGLPIPQLVLATDKKNSGKFIVIDGKQRLSTIISFCVDKNFELTGLPILKDLNNVTYDKLTNDPIYRKYLDSFENNTIRTTQIRNWKTEGFLYLAFLRLNTGSVPLSSQELRQALKPGPFIKWINNITIEKNIMQKIMNLDEPDFRMRDVELLLRYLAYMMFYTLYKGNLKTFLDDTCDRLNKDFNEERLVKFLVKLDRASNLVYEIFGKDSYKKYKNGKYESSFNRAIFDVMVYYFSQEGFTNHDVLSKRDDIKISFEKLCVEDKDFLQSIESTTKSITAVNTRFIKWGNTLIKNGLNINLTEVL